MPDDDVVNGEGEPAPRPGRVRIVGAEPAAQAAAGAPGSPRPTDAGSEDPTGSDALGVDPLGLGRLTPDPLRGDPFGPGPLDTPAPSPSPPAPPAVPPSADAGSGGAAGSGAEPELPHWTEAPTGEVPAVLVRDGDTDAVAVPAPMWREDHSDWEAHEESYDPAILAADEGVPLGALGGAGKEPEDDDRQPWSFDLTKRPDEIGTPSGGADAIGGARAASLADAAADGYDDAMTMVVPTVGDVPSGGPGTPAADSPVDEESRTDVPAGADGTPAMTLGDDDDGVDEVVGDDPRVVGPTGLEPPRTARRRSGRSGAGIRPVPPAPESGSTGGADPAVGTRPVPPAPAVRTRPRPRPRPGPARHGAAVERDDPEERNLPAAITVGVVLGLAALLCFKAGTVASEVLVTVVVLVAAVEGYNSFRRAGYQPAILCGWVATVSLMIAAYNYGLAALPLVLSLMMACTFVWYLGGVEPGADPIIGGSSTIFVFVWTGVLGSFAALLLSPTLFPDRHGIAFLLGAVITTVACDVGGLATGRLIGSHPMAPTISPHKTWEGFVGGAVASILVAVIVVHAISPWTMRSAVILGVVIAIVVPLGDLCESMVKRQLGRKDMSHFLPGHGGVLDRFDGMLFALPATYFLVVALHLG
jgi:phosphatidate cytidylyltransferase